MMDMWIKRWILVGLIFLLSCTIASANPLCGMLKFTDDTRYDKIRSADILSEFVMEKLLVSGKFFLKETKPIDIDNEKFLYNARSAESRNAEIAAKTGKYDAIFEGEGFNDKKAASLGKAKMGQIVYPDIMKEIGEKNGVEYLIQGNIVDFGRGYQYKDEIGTLAFVVQGAANISGATGLASGAGVLAGSTTAKQILGVVVDLRIIKAETGEVVWYKKVTGQADVAKFSTKDKEIQIGTDRLSNEIYTSAMDDAAQAVVTALINDMDARNLLL